MQGKHSASPEPRKPAFTLHARIAFLVALTLVFMPTSFLVASELAPGADDPIEVASTDDPVEDAAEDPGEESAPAGDPAPSEDPAPEIGTSDVPAADPEADANAPQSDENGPEDAEGVIDAPESLEELTTAVIASEEPESLVSLASLFGPEFTTPSYVFADCYVYAECPICGQAHGDDKVEFQFEVSGDDEELMYVQSSDFSVAGDLIDSSSLWVSLNTYSSGDGVLCGYASFDVNTNSALDHCEFTLGFEHGEITAELNGELNIHRNGAATIEFNAVDSVTFKSTEIGNPRDSQYVIRDRGGSPMGLFGGYANSDFRNALPPSSSCALSLQGYNETPSAYTLTVAEGGDSVIDIDYTTYMGIWLWPVGIGSTTVTFNDVFDNGPKPITVTVTNSASDFAPDLEPTEDEIEVMAGTQIDLRDYVDGLPSGMQPYWAFTSSNSSVASVSAKNGSDAGAYMLDANAVGETTITMGLLCENKDLVNASNVSALEPSYSTHTLKVKVTPEPVRFNVVGVTPSQTNISKTAVLQCGICGDDHWDAQWVDLPVTIRARCNRADHLPNVTADDLGLSFAAANGYTLSSSDVAFALGNAGWTLVDEANGDYETQGTLRVHFENPQALSLVMSCTSVDVTDQTIAYRFADIGTGKPTFTANTAVVTLDAINANDRSKAVTALGTLGHPEQGALGAYGASDYLTAVIAKHVGATFQHGYAQAGAGASGKAFTVTSRNEGVVEIMEIEGKPSLMPVAAGQTKVDFSDAWGNSCEVDVVVTDSTPSFKLTGFSTPATASDGWDPGTGTVTTPGILSCGVCGKHHATVSSVQVPVTLRATCNNATYLSNLGVSDLGIGFSTAGATNAINLEDVSIAYASDGWTSVAGATDAYERAAILTIGLKGANPTAEALTIAFRSDALTEKQVKVAFSNVEGGKPGFTVNDERLVFDSRDIGTDDCMKAAVGPLGRSDMGALGAYDQGAYFTALRPIHVGSAFWDGCTQAVAGSSGTVFTVTSDTPDVVRVGEVDGRPTIIPAGLRQAGPNTATVRFSDVWGNTASTVVTVNDSTHQVASELQASTDEVVVAVGESIDLRRYLNGLAGGLNPYWALQSQNERIATVIGGPDASGTYLLEAVSEGEVQIDIGLRSDHASFVTAATEDKFPPAYSNYKVKVRVVAPTKDVVGSSERSDIEGTVHFERYTGVEQSSAIELVVKLASVEDEAEQAVRAHLTGMVDEELLSYVLYEIRLEENGVEAKLDRTGAPMTVSLKLSDEMKELEGLGVYYLDDANKMHALESWVDGDFICFKTPHFSKYVVSGSKPKAADPPAGGDPGSGEGTDDGAGAGVGSGAGSGAAEPSAPVKEQVRSTLSAEEHALGVVRSPETGDVGFTLVLTALFTACGVWGVLVVSELRRRLARASGRDADE